MLKRIIFLSLFLAFFSFSPANALIEIEEYKTIEIDAGVSYRDKIRISRDQTSEASKVLLSILDSDIKTWLEQSTLKSMNFSHRDNQLFYNLVVNVPQGTTAGWYSGYLEFRELNSEGSVVDTQVTSLLVQVKNSLAIVETPVVNKAATTNVVNPERPTIDEGPEFNFGYLFFALFLIMIGIGSAKYAWKVNSLDGGVSLYERLIGLAALVWGIVIMLKFFNVDITSSVIPIIFYIFLFIVLSNKLSKKSSKLTKSYKTFLDSIQVK